MAILNIVFDYGRVLVDWNPRYLYDKVFPTPEESERFIRDICNMEWNVQMDAGKPFSEGTAELAAEHPGYHDEIMMYDSRWYEMMGDQVPGMDELLGDISRRGIHIYGLTNWSAEKLPRVLETYPVFRHIEGMVVSGEEKVVKPSPRIYRLLLEKYGLRAGECLFVDDSPANVDGARAVGMEGVVFSGAGELRAFLEAEGIL